MFRRFVRHPVGQAFRDDRGQDMIEYAIMLGIIAVAVIASITTVGNYVTSTWAALAASL